MLDEYQRNVVDFYEGAALVLAGPGSGKTTCILERILCLIEERHVPPNQILVITFTKDAALEMQERFRRKTGGESKVCMGTFHSIFYHVLLAHPTYEGYGIVYGKSRLQLLKSALKQVGVMDGKTGFLENVERDIAKYRSGGEIKEFQPLSMDYKDFVSVLSCYDAMKESRRKLDFDDMLLKTRELLKKDEAYLKEWQKKFQFFLIDEAQDMNAVQMQLVQMLCSSGNVMAVGDDDQSIYGFRGALPGVLKEFESYFHAHVICLQNNYRSLQEIVQKSQLVITKNPQRYEKVLKSKREDAGTVILRQFRTEREEIAAVIEICREAIRDQKTLGILFRNRQEASALIYALSWEKMAFFTKESYRLAFSDPISQRILDIFYALIKYQENGDLEMLDKSFLGELFDDPLQRDRALRMISHMTPYAILNYLRKGLGLDEYFQYIAESKEQLEEYLMYAEELQEFVKTCKRLDEVWKRVQEMKHFQMKNAPSNPEEMYIRLYTFHGSKGLEFERVIILNVNEGITPSKKASTSEELQEERRMFYVAMTRAKDHLHLFSIQRRRNEILYPSVYLKDLTCPQAGPESRQNA
jgi:DNA helicase-2/ATP-dependent DNA helicase PcrA